MCKEFFDRYSKFGIEPAVLRDIYRFTTDDESTGSSQKEEEVDQRLVNFILESNDTDLLWDLRKLNSHPKNNIWFLLAQTADIYMSLQQLMKECTQIFYIYQSQHPLKISVK